MDYKKIVKQLEDQIELLLTEYKDLFSEEELKNIKRIKFEMLLEQSDIKLDIEMKSCEIALRYFVAKIWSNELTKINDLKNGEDFKMVICQSEDKNERVLYANLVTDKTVEKTNLNYGLICEVDESNLIMSSCEDIKMDFYSPRLLIIHFRSLIEMFEDSFLMSEDYVMGLNFPCQIEESTLETKDNLVLLNREKTKFSGVALFEPCTSFDFQQACFLAEKYGLDIIKFSKENYKKVKQIEKN